MLGWVVPLWEVSGRQIDIFFVHAHRDEIEGKNFKDLKWSANVEK
jgi:hypothetical protein